MNESGEKGKLYTFPEGKIQRTPAKVLELRMQPVDDIAQKIYDRLGRSLDRADREEADRVKAKRFGFSLERLAKEIYRIEERRTYNLPVFPSDIATIELYLSKRKENKTKGPQS